MWRSDATSDIFVYYTKLVFCCSCCSTCTWYDAVARAYVHTSCFPCSCATRCPAAALRQTLHCTHHRNAEQQCGITCAATHLLLKRMAGAAPGGGAARAAVHHVLPPPVGGAHFYPTHHTHDLVISCLSVCLSPS